MHKLYNKIRHIQKNYFNFLIWNKDTSNWKQKIIRLEFDLSFLFLKPFGVLIFSVIKGLVSKL